MENKRPAFLERRGDAGVQTYNNPTQNKCLQGGQPLFPAIVCVGDSSSCKKSSSIQPHIRLLQPSHTHTSVHTDPEQSTYSAPAWNFLLTHILRTAVSVLSADPHLLLSQQKGGCAFEVHSFTISSSKKMFWFPIKTHTYMQSAECFGLGSF